MKSTSNPKQLIVEGPVDLFSVVGLVSAHVEWPKKELLWPVFIQIGNGAEEILKEGLIALYLKGPVVKTFGIMLDADTKPRGRYQSIRHRCAPFFPDMPTDLPSDGLVTENDKQQRLGVWIMPDNSSDGGLETFLKYLVPEPEGPAWKHAEASVATAMKLGCSCAKCHIEKANLYTWLAWQETPGQSPGVSLTKKILDPHSASAAPFVAWFKRLYQL